MRPPYRVVRLEAHAEPCGVCGEPCSNGMLVYLWERRVRRGYELRTVREAIHVRCWGRGPVDGAPGGSPAP